MDKLVNLGSVSQIGNKLASFNPFGKAEDAPSAANESAPQSNDQPQSSMESPTTANAESSDNTAQGEPKTIEPTNSSTLAGASAMFSQAFNPVRNFGTGLGSKLGGLIGQSTSNAEGEKEITSPAVEGTVSGESTSTMQDTTTDMIKTFGSSLFSYGKQASATVLKTTTGALETIKKTVEEKTPIIADFSKEQEKFIEENKQSQAGPAAPPWCGAAGGPEAEEQLKVRIMELSADERNVLRPVPAGQTFDFDIRAHSSIAKLMLSLDPRLDSLRFKFVPKRITEENFWRNYFYRVSLLKQTTDLMSSANSAVANLAAQSASNTTNPANAASKKSSTESPDEQNPDFQLELERAVQQELNEYELVEGAGDLATDENERNLEAEILAEIGSK